MELRQGKQIKNRPRKTWEDPTNLATVQSVSVGFLHVQRTLSMHSMLLLGGLGHAPRIIMKMSLEAILIEI